jgi:hypothetical protein
LNIRNRVVERRRMRGSELTPHPLNWRTHSQQEVDILRDVLKKIGLVGELYVYPSERNGGRLTLINGHLRADQFPDVEWDVAVTDLNDAEADQLLAVYDPISGMAGADGGALQALIEQAGIYDGALRAMLDGMVDGEAAESEAGEAKKAARCEYPITPVMSEHYDYAIIFCTNEIDFAWLQTALRLDRERCYKSSKFKVGRVVPFNKFRELWESRSSSPPTAEPEPLLPSVL